MRVPVVAFLLLAATAHAEPSYWVEAFGPTTLSNWVLAGLAIAGIYTALKTLSGMARQNRISEDSLRLADKSVSHVMVIERAYVSMSHVSPGLVCFTEGLSTNPATVPFGPDNHPGVHVQITNHGHTPANVLAATVVAHVGTELPDEPPYSDYKDWGAFFLMPEDKFFVRRIVSAPLTDEQFRSIQDGTLRMWVLGYVDYIDSFEIRHRTGYARRYSPTDPDNNLVFETKPGYNFDRKG